ncbi:hypothetical protein Godav_019444 [Gossypium davidsonii]|uniref:DUF4283 domain-containing protein n=1 Tax=Gossypium davidsonii TaxID=34287 RepID=A0A7J8R0J5_GOSDV|nr:hypothetical protein [Gossypium davidsonii]
MGDFVGDSTGRFANKVRHRLDELSNSDDSVGNDMGMKANTQKEDDFELFEGDAKEEIVNGIPTITFSEQNDDDYLEALSGGPWAIFGHYLIVHLWTSAFTTDQDHLNSLMVWIRQPGLPKGLYTKSLLKFIERAIEPITKIDRNTDNYTMGQFVRLAIYIDLGKPLISKPEDVPKRTLNGNHGKGASMQRRVGEEKFGPWMVVEYRQRRNSRSGVKAKDTSGDRKAEESRFTILSKNHEGMKDDGLNAIKDNDGNRYSRTVIAYQNLLVKGKTVPLIKSKGFKK